MEILGAILFAVITIVGLASGGVTIFDSWTKRRARLKPGHQRVLALPKGHVADGDALAEELSLERSIDLQDIEENYREGRRRAAADDLRLLTMSEGFALLDASVKASIMLKLAIYLANLDAALDEANKLILEAEKLAPDVDRLPALAVVAYHSTTPPDVETAVALIEDTTTLHRFQLKLSLLLDAEHLDQFEQLWTSGAPSADAQEDPESLRLVALSHLFAGRPDAARDSIQAAIALKPERRSIRFACAVIEYYSVVLGEHRGRALLNGPPSTEMFMVRQDDDSIATLRSAQTRFERIVLESADESIEVRKNAELWWFASLANDAGAQDQAAATARDLLADDPLRPALLEWVLSREYDVDAESMIAPLRASGEHATPAVAAVLVGLFLKVGNTESAATTLSEAEPEFIRTAQRDLYHQLCAYVAFAEQRWSDISVELARLSDVGRRASAMLYFLGAAIDVDSARSHLEETLLRDVEQLNDDVMLLALCGHMAKHGNWEWVAERAPAIVERLNSPAAVTLAVRSLFESGQHELCATALDRWVIHFPERRLPAALREIRMICEVELGRISAALATLDSDEQPATVVQLLNRISIALMLADLSSAALTARKLLESDANADQLIGVVQLLATEDRALARQMWQSAAPRLSATNVTGVLGVQLGFSLGLHEEAGALMRRLGTGGAAGIEILQGQEVRARLAELSVSGAEHEERFRRAYQGMAVPLSVITGQLRVPFVSLLFDVSVRLPALIVRSHIRPSSRSQFSAGKVRLDGTTFLLLARLGQLEKVYEAWGPLQISRQLAPALTAQLDQLLAQRAGDSGGRALQREWLREQLDVLRVGIETGEFVFVVGGDDTEELSDLPGHDWLATKQLATAPAPEPIYLAIDDAYFSREGHLMGHAVTGVCELLRELCELDRLEWEQYYELLLELRGLEFDYLPASSGELVFHLRAAARRSGGFAETPALTTLRRYFARTLTALHDGGHVHSRDGRPAFLAELASSIQLAMIECWRDDGILLESIVAMADWILRWLHIGLAGLKSLAGGDGLLEYLGMELAHALAIVVTIFPNERRQRYFEWIVDNVVDRRLRVDPSVAVSAATALERLLDQQARMCEAEQDRRVVRALQHQLLLELPSPLIDALEQVGTLPARLGIERLRAVRIGQFSFSARTFWSAVAEVMNGRKTTVTAHRPDEPVLIELEDAGTNTLVLVGDHSGTVERVRDPLYSLLNAGVAERLALLRQHEIWFDRAQSELLMRQLAGSSDPVALAERILDSRSASVAFRYHELDAQIGIAELKVADVTVRDADSYLHHLRLVDDSQDIRSRVRVAAECLIEAYGVVECFRRTAGIPGHHSPWLLDAIAGSDAARNEILAEMLEVASSPAALLQLICLVSALPERDPDTVALARRALELLTGDSGRERFELFQCILGLVSAEADGMECEQSTRLAIVWSHASRLFSILDAHDAPMADLTVWFRGAADAQSARQLLAARSTDADLAHPTSVHYVAFVLRGLAFACDGFRDEEMELLAAREAAQAIFGTTQRDQLTHPGLLTNTDQWLDMFGAMWSETGDARVTRLLGDEGVLVTRGGIRALTERAVDRLNETVQEDAGWVALNLHVGPAVQDGPEAQRLVVMVERISQEAWADGQLMRGVSMLQFGCRVSMLLDEAQRARLVGSLLNFATALATNDMPADVGARFVSVLLGAAHDVSRHDARPSERFARLVARILERWPESASLMPGLVRLPNVLPHQQLADIWPCILRIRQLASVS